MFLLELLKKWLSHETLSSELERYIASHNPQSTYDIERLTEEFERRRFLQGDTRL